MRKLSLRLNYSPGWPGWFNKEQSQSYQAVSKSINLLVDKVNELVEDNNRLHKLLDAKSSQEKEGDRE